MSLAKAWKRAVCGGSSQDFLLENLKKSYPPLTSVVFTRECNLNCRHCIYPKADSKDCSLNNLDRIDKIISATYKAGVRDLIHVGRTLSKEHLPILMKYQNRGMEISLIDNGSAAFLIEDIISEGVFFSGGIDISIDGNKNSHELQRGKGSWDLAIKGIEILRQVADNISVTGTASRLNYNSISKSFLSLRKRYPWIKTFQITTTSSANHHKKRMYLATEEMEILFSEILKHSEKLSLHLAIYRLDDLLAILPKLSGICKPEEKYISIEWKIGKLKVSYFPESIVIAEELGIDSNGMYILPFSLDHHIATRPDKWQVPGDLIIEDSDKAYEKACEKYWKTLGKKSFERERAVLNNIF